MALTRQEIQARYRIKHKEEIKARDKFYYHSHKILKRDKHRESCKNDPNRLYSYHLKGKYNLLWEDYLKMIKDQGGLCKICNRVEKENVNLSVDHCHTTGKIRGLLCRNCNRALGLFEDNIKSLNNAAQYLSNAQR